MAKFIVTGGAGFIGSHLCESLIGLGHKIINIDNFSDYYSEKIKINNVLESLSLKINNVLSIDSLKEIVNSENYILENIDIRDSVNLERIYKKNLDVDCVIHLAAMAGVRPSIENPSLYLDVNVVGTQNILEASKRHNIKKIIIASSSSVYGNNKTIPFKETDIVDFPISPYAATKKSVEILSHSYHHLYDINVLLLRFFTVYGPRQRPDLAIYKFVKNIYNNEPIPFYGDGSSKRDYTYVDDIINGILKSIDYIRNNSNVYEIINLGENTTISLSELVKLIEVEIGHNALLKRYEKQPGDVEITYSDISKAKKMIGYNPNTNINLGIKEFIKWFIENKRYE